MACNSCAKPFSLLRKEKGCPGCGFSYCSKCLENIVFLPKLNAEAKVCPKCKRSPPSNESKKFEAPDAYYKRIGLGADSTNNPAENKSNSSQQNPTDEEIQNRLHKLKENKNPTAGTSNDDIANRLQKIKGDIPNTTDAELQERLAKLRGVPISVMQTQPVLPVADSRTEQEQADDLLKQYMSQANMDTKYHDEFDILVKGMESRLGKLKGAEGTSEPTKTTEKPESESDDEESAVRKIVAKMKAEASLEPDDLPPSTNDELPFCEICNEDATLRCLGCRYLFCKRCFLDHKDDDDGCNRYESYKAPKND